MLKKMSGILLEPSNKYIIPEQILIETLLKSQQLRLEAMGLMTQIKEKHQGRGGSSGSSTGSSGSSGSGKSLDMQYLWDFQEEITRFVDNIELKNLVSRRIRVTVVVVIVGVVV